MSTKSFYGTVYRGGIALPMGLENLIFVLHHNSDVEVLERFTPQEAYIFAAQKYSERKNQLQRYTQPIIPTIEVLTYKSFHEPNFIECVPSLRFFSAIADGYAGVFTSVESVTDFLGYFHPTYLKEFSTLDDALWHVNWFFLKKIFPRIAYITSPIQYLKEIPLNSAVPLQFFGDLNNTFPTGLEITYPELTPPSEQI